MINKAYESGGESPRIPRRGDARVVVDATAWLGQPAAPNSPYFQAVAPSVQYNDGQTAFVPPPRANVPQTEFSQRCICAPKTAKERKLFIAVIVLVVACFALLTTLITVLPFTIKDAADNILPDFVKRPLLVEQEIARLQAEAAGGAH